MAHVVAKILVFSLLLTPLACGKSDPPATVIAETEAAAGPVEGDDPIAAAEAIAAPPVIDVSELPRQFMVETELLEANITIPDEVFIIAPALASSLVEEAEAALATAKQSAQASRSVDEAAFRPHVLRIDWQVTGGADDMLSLEKFVYEYSGGAHPVFATSGRIHDAKAREDVSFRDMLVGPESAINSHLDVILDALVAQKIAAGVQAGAEDIIRGELSDIVTADTVLSGAVSLVDATTPGKFGGYVVHFAPYEIGSFAEGGYHVTVPQTDFKPYLKPEYAGLFAGAPVSVERPDDK